MKKLILCLSLFLFPFIQGYCAEQQQINLTTFNGMVDKIAPEDINDTFSTDNCNVLTDEVEGSLVKPKGYNLWSSTYIVSGQKIETLYTYRQVDGDEYLIAQASGTVAYSDNGVFSVICSTLNPSYKCSFTTGRDYLIGSNGSEYPFSWDGSSLEFYTTSNSTGMVKGRYVVYWNNRLVLAGVDNYRSTVYLSEVNDPWNIIVSKNINVSDGDLITAFFIWQNRLLVFKRNSLWEIVEDSPGNFRVRCLSYKIGCLYADSIQEKDGFPCWVSSRGVEQYTGEFALASKPIDIQFKDLKQLVSGENVWNLSTASDWASGTYGSEVVDDSDPLTMKPQDSVDDWNAGTLVNIDTTTYSGSLSVNIETVANDKAYLKTATASDTKPTYTTAEGVDRDITTSWLGDTTIFANKWFKVDLGAAYSTLFVRLKTYSYKAVPALGQNAKLQISADDSTWQDVKTLVEYGATYENSLYDNISSGDAIYISTSTRYIRIYYTYVSATEGFVARLFDLYAYHPSSGTFTSQVLDYGFETEYFGNLVASVTVPSGTDIDYYTRSSTDNTTWGSWSSSIDNGDLIPSTTAQYLQWKATLNANTTQYYTPQIHSVYVGGAWRSEVKDLTATPVSFGNMTGTETNDDIYYYLRSAASTATLATTAFTQQYSGSPVTITPGRYVQMETRFNVASTSTITSPPSLSAVSIPYYLSSVIPMHAITYKDRYILSASTGDATTNNICYVYNTKGEWNKFDYIKMSATCLYKNRWMTGDYSGLIYLQDIDDVYTANGTAYNSYWDSKVFDNGTPLLEKTYNTLWAIAKGETTGNLYVKYRLDGTTDWTSKTLPLSNTWNGTAVEKIPQEMATKGRFIQYRIEDNSATSAWQFKQLIQLYSFEMPR